MEKKIWKISNINTKSIPFDLIFKDRNKYNLTDTEFFEPSLTDEHDAGLMLNMNKAINRINQAIKEKQKIYIYGDYDVDGISATAILLKTFILLSYNNVSYHIPNRKDDGYGVNISAIDKIHQDDCKLIITVDCGITAVKETDHANNLGIDMIITDHHQVPKDVPKAYAIINPHQQNCKYPYKNLCGAGIAYKLSNHLLKSNDISPSKEILEIASIATVADIMELNGENRVIVKNGIQEIKNSRNLGIDALLNEAGIDKNDVSTYTIGFGIAPRINSAGRIDDAALAVRLYMAKNEIEAKTYANKLNFLNYKRQEMVKNIYEESLEQAKQQPDNMITVTYSSDWDLGVIGIVASRLVDEFNKPAIVISLNNGIGSASCRSLPSFNIFEFLSNFANSFDKFGGHDMAAGFSIKQDKIPKFIERINKRAKNILDGENFKVYLNSDCLINTLDINEEIYDKILSFEPFGVGNEKLRFIATDIELEQHQFIGKDAKHFKAIIKNNHKNMLKFNAYDELKDFDFSKKIDVAFSMNKNTYNDNVTIQMFAEDIRYSYDYVQDYGKIYNIVSDNCAYFNMKYSFSLVDITDFTTIDLSDLSQFEENTAYLCYSYQSYFYIRKLLEYASIEADFYQDNKPISGKHTIILFPLLDKTELSLYKNIVICDDIKHIEKIIYSQELDKYILDFDRFNASFSHYEIRQTMVIIYNLYKKYPDKYISIEYILDILKLDPIIFFIINSILQNSNLIDIIYDFQYNKVCTKIIDTSEKQNLNDNFIYKKCEEYFDNIK